MKKKPDSLVYIIGLLLVIVAGIITTAIISSVKNNQAPADIRARAGVVNTLKLNGTVTEVDSVNGTITASNVEFSKDSRSGPERNYGTWIVTPPRTFNLLSARPGMNIEFVVSSSSLNVEARQVVASQVTVR